MIGWQTARERNVCVGGVGWNDEWNRSKGWGREMVKEEKNENSR